MKVIIIKHIGIEGPGTIADYLEDNNIAYEVIDIFNGGALPDSLSNVSSVITLGGPMNVYEEDKYPFLKDENEFLKDVIERDIPTLGFCLGAQLIAKAKGAVVKKAPEKEIGWFKISLNNDGLNGPLFQGFSREVEVFQWHGDMFEIPDGAVALAKSDVCPNQAFRIGKNVYGLQFHVEVTGDMVLEWLASYKDELDTLKGLVDPDKIISDTRSKSDSYAAQSKQFCLNFFNLSKGG